MAHKLNVNKLRSNRRLNSDDNSHGVTFSLRLDPVLPVILLRLWATSTRTSISRGHKVPGIGGGKPGRVRKRVKEEWRIFSANFNIT